MTQGFLYNDNIAFFSFCIVHLVLMYTLNSGGTPEYPEAFIPGCPVLSCAAQRMPRHFAGSRENVAVL